MAPPSQDPDALASQLAHDLPSPYCPGRSIASCPSDAARVLEREILTQARAGDSRETIEANLVARFGEGTLGREFRTDVMVGTVVLVVLAVVAIVIVGKRWSRRRPTNSATEGVVKAPNADELASLEAELADVREL